MLRAISAIIIVVVILLAWSTSADENLVNGTIFTDNKTGLSLTLPSDIRVIAGSDEDEHDLFLLTGDNVTLMRIRVSESDIIVQDPKKLVENLTRTGNYSLVRSEAADLAGLSGWLKEYTWSGSDGIAYRAQDIVATRGSSVYSVRLASPESDTANLSMVHRILESLVITPREMSRSTLQYEGDPMGIQYWYYNKDQDLWTNEIPQDYSGWDTYYTEIADNPENLIGLFSYEDDYPTTETLYGFQYNDPYYYPESGGSTGYDTGGSGSDETESTE